MIPGRQSPDMNLTGKLSIRRKVMLIGMLTSSVALLLACAVFLSNDMHVYRQSTLSQLSSIADAVGTNSIGALTFADSDSATRTLRVMRERSHVIAAATYDAKGKRFVSYIRDGADRLASFPENADGESRFTRNELDIFRPIWLDGQRIGTVFVQSDLSDIHDRLRRYAGVVLLVALSCLAVVYILGGLLQRTISAPIQELSNVMQTVGSEKNYLLRAPKHTDDEL